MDDIIQKIAVYAIPVIFAITVHEAAHGYVARMFGDNTAYVLGRVTLNPLKHIDPLGTIVIPIAMVLLTGFMFGWAKPVPVDWGSLRKPKRDMIWVAAAGPGVNLVMAVIWALVYRTLAAAGVEESYFYYVAQAGIAVNLVFMALNLLPIPPLDGSRIVESLLSDAARRIWNDFAVVSPVLLAAVVLLPILGGFSLLAWPMHLVNRLIVLVSGS